VSSAACAPTPDVFSISVPRPARLGWALRRLRSATGPPCTGALLRLFGRLQQVREQRTHLKALVRRARLFTPDVADEVATLARSNPDAALEAFVSTFQREHFELDEAICEQGFEVWADVAAESIPLLLRATDRCNGIEPQGYRPGYALQWALIEDAFSGDERSEVIAEVAETFGKAVANRLETADPPPHYVLCTRLARSPYVGVVAFSRWALGSTSAIMMLLANSQAAGASATKREVCVWECVGSVNQATSRTRFIAIAIRTCWSCVFGKPR